MALGIIFFFLLIGGAWFYVADPYELRPLIESLRSMPARAGSDSATNESVSSQNPKLSPAQNAALETVGINPAAVPTSFTPEQRACMLEAVGSARAEAILGGAAPTAEEFVKARACL